VIPIGRDRPQRSRCDDVDGRHDQLQRRALFLDVLLSHDDVALPSIEPLLWLRLIEALWFRIQYGRRRHAGASGAGVMRMSYTQKLWMRVKRKAAYLPG
jgi:hypothetical protein